MPLKALHHIFFNTQRTNYYLQPKHVCNYKTPKKLHISVFVTISQDTILLISVKYDHAIRDISKLSHIFANNLKFIIIIFVSNIVFE